MANVNTNKPPNLPNPPPTWRARSPLNLTPPLHDLPQDFEKMLPKFDPSENILVDDHLQSFYLAIEGLRAGEHEDVVCRLFPHTLKGAAASWYFALPTNSITDWDTFERIFRSKYAVQKTHAALMKGFYALKKERKEKVHSFTQRFAAYLKNFSATDKPSNKVLIEYHTSDLGPNLAMLAKMQVKPTLSETYEEAERVEAERESIEYYPEQLSEKTFGKKALLFTKPKE